MGLEDVPTVEELEDYRMQARSWLAANMPPLDPMASPQDQTKEQLRDLMRRLWDGGYSGIQPIGPTWTWLPKLQMAA